MGLAAQMLPSVGVAAQGGERKIGYAVIGLGTIATTLCVGCSRAQTRRLQVW